ncbi:MAG: 16S rRNA (guanine(966)-N(2))-methyltransferase RsmD, partial [Gammaproteobacteria bacterium]
RKLRFAASAAIRPTPDRVRETLFNWLGARTPGARALDLFAGSGALGLEALSRGAAHVTFVEHDEAAVRELRARLAAWQAGDARVVRADALRYLAGEARPFDLVFLDPPFASELLGEAARLLEERHWLEPGALIYLECAARAGLPPLPAPWGALKALECAARAGLPPLPAPWGALKAKQAGEVGYHLFARTAPLAADTA